MENILMFISMLQRMGLRGVFLVLAVIAMVYFFIKRPKEDHEGAESVVTSRDLLDDINDERKEQEMLQVYLQPRTDDNVGKDVPEHTQEEIAAAIDAIKKEFESKWKGCTLKEIYYAGIGVSRQHQDWADRNNADDVIVLLSSFETGSYADPSLKPNSTYDNYMWILVRTDGGEWIHVDHGYYIPIL